MSDRGDHGSFADEQNLPDRGTPPAAGAGADGKRTLPEQISPSYDLFGNPLLPAAPEAQAPPPATVTAGKTQASASANKLPTPAIIIAVAGVCLFMVIGFFAFKAFNGAHTTNPIKTNNPEPLKLTAGDTTLSPTDIFKHCGPSIVTLTIVTKALQVKADQFDVTSLNGEDPILAAVDEEGKPVLYQKGKPSKVAVGMIATAKGKMLVGVRLIGTQPVLIPVSEKGEPILRDGKPVIISNGVHLKSYMSESIGSGFYVRPEIVATNCHVVSEGPLGAAGFAGGLAQITDKPGKFTITDKPIAIDQDHDLALLYIPGTDAKPLTLRADYSGLKVGESVYALGSPKGLAGSLSEGLISSDKLRGQNPRDPDSPKMYLQHSARSITATPAAHWSTLRAE